MSLKYTSLAHLHCFSLQENHSAYQCPVRSWCPHIAMGSALGFDSCVACLKNSSHGHWSLILTNVPTPTPLCRAHAVETSDNKATWADANVLRAPITQQTLRTQPPLSPSQWPFPARLVSYGKTFWTFLSDFSTSLSVRLPLHAPSPPEFQGPEGPGNKWGVWCELFIISWRDKPAPLREQAL